MVFPAKSDRFRDRVAESFKGQPFMEFLDARLSMVEPGVVEIELAHRPELTQQHGFFHGGVVATLADNASGFAAFSLMADEEQPLSVEFKINLFARAVGDRLVARGEVHHDGRTLKICRSEVVACSGEVRRPCATAIVTVIALRDMA